VLSSDGLRWCLTLTEPFFLAGTLAAVSAAFFLGAACALLAKDVRPSAMQAHTMVVRHTLGSGLWLSVVCMCAPRLAGGSGGWRLAVGTLYDAVMSISMSILTCAKRLVAEAGLGLVPGKAFGEDAQGWAPWCFASKDPQRRVPWVGRLKKRLGL
jgi:hypothetical protein